METSSLSPATESFSYSWLSNSKSSLDGLLPEPPLRLSFHSSYQNFNFDVSNLQSPSIVAHADELFSDGLIRSHVFVDPFRVESCNNNNNNSNTKDSIETTMLSCSSVSSRTISAKPVGVSSSHGYLRKQRLKDFFHLLVSRFCCKFGLSRKSTRVGHIDKAEREATQKALGAYCNDHENSIYEAVLHCKRSFEN
ncbi:probable membrane-associated kinase regulator 6 [Prosopis cineraria]|uniref:probable membrane-associated kinase regulator 6 n=1 Tax=Prosopis cineraria TaxID=364024 RepID=UPI00241078B9|nr:probable membrane-associated kinase regulator 6 [Prosopis cineraria]